MYNDTVLIGYRHNIFTFFFEKYLLDIGYLNVYISKVFCPLLLHTSIEEYNVSHRSKSTKFSSLLHI